MGQDDFHEGLGASWEEGQEGVRFSIKTSVLRGTVTWICPQLSVPWTYKTQRTDERRFFSGDLERLWVQEQPPFGHQVISPRKGGRRRGTISPFRHRLPVASAFRLEMQEPRFGGFRTPELS